MRKSDAGIMSLVTLYNNLYSRDLLDDFKNGRIVYDEWEVVLSCMFELDNIKTQLETCLTLLDIDGKNTKDDVKKRIKRILK